MGPCLAAKMQQSRPFIAHWFTMANLLFTNPTH